MLFQWNEQTLRWFEAASAYTGFHRELASIVRPHIADCTTFCDIGCGLGLLDLELAQDVRSVFCIDRNETAIAALRALICARGAHNVAARAADVNALAGERWDAVIMSFFGSSTASIAHFLSFCDKRMILIVHENTSANRRANAAPRRPKPLDAIEVAGFLTDRGARFRKIGAVLEFGQPFTSLADVREFVRVYANALPFADDGGADADWERPYGDAEKRLIETGRSDYPLYLPKRKGLAVFVVEKAAQQDRIGASALSGGR
ncbi:MAG: class I SAM-dependent methyltransferase [Clostridiales Family XIII bacterium]|jgi:SAM-dependent methyltransferase|nr:class I SAM-dependent methyltransferase [Clostridiales Family XIII bacterium]